MNSHDTAAGMALKAAPPAGVGGLTVLGVTLPDWILILTLIYTILSIVALVRDKYIGPWLEKRRERSGKQ